MANHPVAVHDQAHPPATDCAPAPGTTSGDRSVAPSHGAFEVRDRHGELGVYAAAADLRDAILSGHVTRADSARAHTAANAKSNPESNWTTVESIAIKNAVLRPLYRPIWARALKYAATGASAGIVLKAVDTTITLFMVNPTAGMLWLTTMGSLLLARKWPVAPMIAIAISINAMPQVNFFMMFLGTAAVGMFFGALLGLISGTLAGYVSPAKEQIAPDSVPEGSRTIWLGLVIPAVVLVVAGSVYVWLELGLAAGDLTF